MTHAERPRTFDDLLADAGWARELALALVGERATADDLVQDAWVAALRNPPPEDVPARAWLARVIRNLARNRWRGERRREHREREVARPEAMRASDEVAQELDLQRALIDALASLPEPLRATVVRRYLHGASSAEIARAEGCPESTVRTRLKRGLDELRVKLDRRYGEREAWLAAFAPLARRGALTATTRTAAPLLATVGAAKLSTLLVALLAVAVAGGKALLGRETSAPELAASEPPVPAESSRGSIESRSSSERRVVLPALAAVAAPTTAVEPPATAPAANTRQADAVAWLEARLVTTDGLPIEGGEALVTDRSALGQIPAGDAPRARSGADGRVRLEVRRSDRAANRGRSTTAPPEQWTLQVAIRGPAHEARVDHHAFSPDATTSLGDVVLRPGGSIAGRLRTADGSPLPEQVWVVVVHPERSLEQASGGGRGWRRADGITASAVAVDGTYSIEGVLAGAWRVTISANHGAWTEPASEIFEVAAGGTTTAPDLVLEPDPLAITGVVRDLEGSPLRSISVLYRASDGSTGGWIGCGPDRAGRFEVAVDDDVPHDLYAMDVGRGLGEAYYPAVRPGTRGLDLRIVAPSWIEVHVAGERGQPLTGFSIATRYPGDDGTQSGNAPPSPEGVARVLVRAVPFLLVVSADGHGETTLGPISPVDPPARLDVVLPKVRELAGLVRFESAPFAGASVELHRIHDGGETLACDGFPTRFGADRPGRRGVVTGPDGRFSFTLREPGRYAVVARADGLASAESAGIVNEPGLVPDDLALELSRGGSIAGRVVPPDGTSPAGVLVGVSRGDGWIESALVGEDGSYSFAGLAPGSWTIRRCEREHRGHGNCREVRGFHPSLATLEVLEGGTTRFDLDLRDASCALAGSLPGVLTAGTTWTATLTPEPDWRGASAQVDAAGRFVLDASRLGPHRLELADAGERGRERRIVATLDLARGVNSWGLELELGAIEGSAAPGSIVSHAWRDGRGAEVVSRALAAADGGFRLEAPWGRGQLSLDGRVEEVEALPGRVVRVPREP